MNTSSDNFGFRLRSLIEGKKTTVDAFADGFGIARSTAHLWLKRAAPPLEKHWRPLADFFGVSENYVAHGRARPPLGMVAEQPAHFGEGPDLLGGIERHYEELLLTANNDPSRLGWIREQMKEHLAIPRSWRKSSPDPATTVVRVELPSQALPAKASPSRRARPA